MIHALPGMGADERMFPSPWNNLPNFAAHNWKVCCHEKSLVGVAKTLCSAGAIADGDSLIGASLGGMVACEIAKIRKIKKLFLVGSAIHAEEINGVLQMFHPLAKIAPIDWLRLSAGKVPHELAHMFAEADPDFIRAMCLAVFDWEGLGITDTQIYRIHGQHDLVIPPPKNADLLLKGGHLISTSHAAECVRFIRDRLSN
jgi:pimeloyl-ACP methyl ester carboxylesterase